MNRCTSLPALLPLVLMTPTLALHVNAAETTLDTVIVTSSRSDIEQDKSPQVVTIISREEIERQLAISSDSSEVLGSLLPSYTPSRQKMTGSGETFRGRTPLILVDGVPQSNPLRPSGRESHTIDFSMVEQIEVLHGASAIHGLGATGGIINIITRRPEQGRFNQHVSVHTTIPTSNLGTDTTSYKAAYRLDGQSGNVDYLLGLSYEDQGLFVDGSGEPVGVDNTQGDQMDSRSYDILAKLGYWIDDNKRTQASLNRYEIKGNHNYVSVTGDRANGIPTTSERGTPEGTAPYNKVWTTNIGYDDFDLYGMKLSAQLFNQEFEGLFGATNSGTFQDASIAPVGTLYDQSRVLSSKWGLKTSLTKDGLMDDRLKLTGGFDVLHDKSEQDLYLTGRTWVPAVEYLNYAPFLQAEFQLTDDLVLHGGLRHEIAELDIATYQTLASANSVTVAGGKPSFDETLFNIGAVYDLTDSVSLFANYAEGFGMPDAGRALRGINIPGQNVDTFLNLKPIVTDNIEVGTRYRHDHLDVELSYYRSSSEFGSRLERIGDDFFMRRQKTVIDGAEAALGYRLDEQNKVKLAYSYIRGRYDSTGDGQVNARLDGLNIAPNRLIASWSSDWNDQLSSFIQANYAFDRSFDDPKKEFDGYLLVDASLGYRLPYGRLELAVANLFDKDYVTYYSQSALVNDERYFKGRGRTLTLGYSLDF